MTYQSHLAWAAGAACVAWGYRQGIPDSSQDILLLSGWIAFALIGGLLPDIDHPQSWLGRRIPLIPTLLYKTTGHRGATHSALAIMLTVAATWFAMMNLGVNYAYTELAVLGLAIGYTAHLAGDMLSNRGIPFFWPCPVRIGIPLCRTGSAAERLMTIGFIFLSGGVTYYLLEKQV